MGSEIGHPSKIGLGQPPNELSKPLRLSIIRMARLSAFLSNNGGIEGAARARAKFGREMSERDECHARSRNAV
jgi:hypothetical protein